MQAGQELAEVSAVGTTARNLGEDLVDFSPWDRPTWQPPGLSRGLQCGQSLWQALSTRCAASLAVLMTPLPGEEGTAPCQAPTRLGVPMPTQCHDDLPAHAVSVSCQFSKPQLSSMLGASMPASTAAAWENLTRTLHTMCWGTCSNGSLLLLSICQVLVACTGQAGRLQV